MTRSLERPLPPSAHRVRPPARRGRRVRPGTIAGAIGLGAVLCVLWPVAVTLGGAAPVSVAALIAHLAGMAAGYGVVVLIVLMSRSPLLERSVGADRLARWHGRGGRIVVSAVLVHALAAVLAWAHARSIGLAQATGQVLRMPWLISATIGTVTLLVVAALSIRAARRRVSFERWHAIHLLVYLAVALGFVHQLGGPDLAGHRALQVVWALLYTQAFALVLTHRVIAPLRSASRHRMRVVDIVPEGAGVVSLIVEGQHLDELGAQAGQFFRWRFLTPDSWWTAHPFSLSAPPTDTRLRLTVKSLGDGSEVLQHVDPGTWVMAEGPYGAMTAARRTREHVLLVAAGVGITPMRALFETMPMRPGQDLLLLYRVRDNAPVVFARELEEIARRRGARLSFLGDRDGRFTPELLHRLVPDVRERDVFLCGPPAMAAGVRQSLRALGLDDSQVHEERFEF